MRSLSLLCLLMLAPIAALAQPPPRIVVVAKQPALVRHAPILKAALREKKPRVTARPVQTRRPQLRPRLRATLVHPNPLHILGSSLQGLPPPPPPHTIKASPVPTALRQLQYQLDLVQIQSAK